MKELEKILEKIKTNRKDFESEMKKARNNEQWEKLLEKWFRISTWPHKNYLEVDKELKKRKPFIKDGFKWHPESKTYKIPPELDFEYALFLERGRKTFDLKMHRRLYARRKEGRHCAHCSIYVKSNKPKKCPICGRRLFYARVTED